MTKRTRIARKAQNAPRTVSASAAPAQPAPASAPVAPAQPAPASAPVAPAQPAPAPVASGNPNATAPNGAPASTRRSTRNNSAHTVCDGSGYKNGPAYGFRYWHAETRTWGLTSDIWAAKQISNGIYDFVWAWYDDGHIDHLMSKEEIERYCP